MLHCGKCSTEPRFSISSGIFCNGVLKVSSLMSFCATSTKGLRRRFRTTMSSCLRFYRRINGTPRGTFDKAFGIHITPRLREETTRGTRRRGASLGRVIRDTLTRCLRPSRRGATIVILPPRIAGRFARPIRAIGADKFSTAEART